MKYRFFILISILCFFSQCKKETNNSDTGIKVSNLVTQDSDLSLFSYALTRTNLNVFTNGPGPFTFFAPTNAAFASSNINSTSDIDKIDTAMLAVILSSHFTPSTMTYDLLPKGPNATLSMQNSLTNYLSKYDNGNAYINGIQIINQGSSASNGEIFKINEVLPVTYNGINNLTVLSDLGYDLMVQAIRKTSILTVFTTNPSTIFAIPNSVMIANGYDSAAIEKLSSTALTSLANKLRYHVLPNRIFKSDFTSGSFPTRYTGNSVNIINNSGSISIKGTNNSSAIAVSPTMIKYSSSGFTTYALTSSGVFYTINSMLLP